eukprot:6509875-Alexandrium_andersonii.AAC.1
MPRARGPHQGGPGGGRPNSRQAGHAGSAQTSGFSPAGSPLGACQARPQIRRRPCTTWLRASPA